MRKALVGAVGVIGLVIVAEFSAYALAVPKGPTKRAFTQTLVGAKISSKGRSSEYVYKTTDSLYGSGATVDDLSTTGAAFPLSGTATSRTYFASGVSISKSTFKIFAPNASGIVTSTGSGKCVGGTGVHKNEKCKWTFRGTINLKTTIAKFKITGTYTR
jgi:hypothetical protein